MTTEAPAVRVLIVDEEERLTEVLTLALEFEGWQVSVARTGRDAVAAVSEAGDSAPDVILLDVDLPDTDGRDVAATLRARGVTTPIVFLTGRATLEDRLAGFQAGADDYITKPFGLEEVVERLDPIIRRIGRASTSRRYGDLVLDVATSEVWRGDERIVLNPLEFEMLRELVGHGGEATTLGGIVRAVTARGVRITRQSAEWLMPALRAKVNAAGAPLMRLAGPDAWVLAV